jgi:hypothetical protein
MLVQLTEKEINIVNGASYISSFAEWTSYFLADKECKTIFKDAPPAIKTKLTFVCFIGAKTAGFLIKNLVDRIFFSQPKQKNDTQESLNDEL